MERHMRGAMCDADVMYNANVAAAVKARAEPTNY